MPLKYASKTITLEGLADIPTTLNPRDILDWNVSHGARWGIARIRLAGAYATETIDEGDACTIKVDEVVAFKGHVIATPRFISEGVDDLFLDIADLRWDMARVKLGQYGVGNLFEMHGGFPVVGYRLQFNPGGRWNRSAELDEESGVYTFATDPSAQAWTRRQILEFILAWYYPELELDPETLSARWGAIEYDFQGYMAPVPDVLTELARRAGESWTLSYVDDAVQYLPVCTTPRTRVTLDLPEASGGAKASGSTSLSVLDIQVLPSIADSTDIVEVHTAPIAMECLHSNHGENPLLISDDTTDLAPPGFSRVFRVDVTKYETYGLGKNLPAGSRAKPWLRQNITRYDPETLQYIAAQTTNLKTLAGRPMVPEHCFWINIGAFHADRTIRYRVKSGFTLRYDEGFLLVHNEIELADGTKYEFDDEDVPQMYVWITLTTQLEYPYIAKNVPTTWHVDEAHPIRTIIQRSDIRPLVRYKTLLPDLTSTDISATKEFETAASKYYVEIATDLAEVGNAYLSARENREITLRARLLDIPAIAVGAGILVSPATVPLSGKEVITEVNYNAREEYVTLLATNNLARVLADEL